MDAFWSGVISAVPSLGIYSGFAYVLILLLRRESNSEERHARELDRVRKMHDEELEELRKDIARERTARRQAEQELEDHREHR